MRIKSLINWISCFSFLAVAAIGISSCKNSNNATTSVQVINASPDAGPVNFYLSGNLKTTTPVTYGNSSGYFSTVAGNQTGEVKSSASSATLVSTPINLASNDNYSVYVSGQTSANSLSTIVVHDNLTAPSSGKAKVRFVNTVVGSPQVNLMANTTAWFSASSYKSNTDFMEITPGTYALSAVSTSTVVVGTTPISQTFVSGKIYTIYFKGVVGATADALKLSLGITANN